MLHFEPDVFRTLDILADGSGLVQGVAIQTLDAGTILTLQTHNSTYRLVVLDGQHVLVTGGVHFRERTEARVEGATAGGSAVKTGWIGIGLRLELRVDSRRVTTSPVQSIDISPPTPLQDPWPDRPAATRE